MKIINSKTLFIFVLCTVLFCTSCSSSKFNKAVDILGSLPVFFDENPLNQTVSFENESIILSFSYQPQTAQWANNVIGSDWVVPIFLRRLFNNAISVYAIGAVLETKEGESPIDVFLDMAEKKKVNFIIRNHDQETVLPVKEVRSILNDDSEKNMAAPFFALQLEKYAEYYNSVLKDKGLYMVNANIESTQSIKNVLCMNINCLENLDVSKINVVSEKLLANYPALIAYCIQNEIDIAFRYHTVCIKGLLTSNKAFAKLSSDSNLDKTFFVSSVYLSQLWKDIKKEMDKKQSEH